MSFEVYVALTRTKSLFVFAFWFCDSELGTVSADCCLALTRSSVLVGWGPLPSWIIRPT